MEQVLDITRRARALPKSERRAILKNFKETELHQQLRELFRSMQPDYLVEITHGASELGKDLVIVKKDNISEDVIAVIVKCGDIKGKTVGDIEDITEKAENILSAREEKRLKEIKSQVSQANKHPASYSSRLSLLLVSKIYIVLAGELSKQARARVAKELQGNHEIFDLEWLVEKFTHFYPHVFFEGKYLDLIQNQIQLLETKNYLYREGKNLSDYFVEPVVATLETKNIAGEITPLIQKKKMPFSKLINIIGKNRKILLLGDQGVGKSGAVSKLAIDLYKRAANDITINRAKAHKIKIPLLISAKEFSELNSAVLLLKYLGVEKEMDKFGIEVLIIDALDEVPRATTQELLSKAEVVAEELKSSLLVTSRKSEALKTSSIEFDRYELMPFEIGQAVKVFEKLVTGDVLTSLKDGLNKISFKIPLVPLSLILLIRIVEDNKEIPASVTELYKQFTELMLGRWDQEKGIEVIFAYVAKNYFLANLAYEEFFKKERLEIPREEFEFALNNYAKEYGWDEQKTSTFAGEIERAGILAIGELVAFRHRSFLDFFTATYLNNKKQNFPSLNDHLVDIYFDPLWSNIA